MEQTQISLKGKGHLLRAKLAIANIILAGVLSFGIFIFAAYRFQIINFYSIWCFILALAFLGLSALFGGLAVSRVTRSLTLNNDWPIDKEYSNFISWQKGLLCLAWILLVAGLILSVYVRRPPYRPPTVRREPPTMNQMDRTPTSPFGGRMERPGRVPGQGAGAGPGAGSSPPSGQQPPPGHMAGQGPQAPPGGQPAPPGGK